jgi:hypothetical protein
MPRFRAMRPVRIEFGVHLDVEAPAFTGSVVLKCLHTAAGEIFQSLSIVRRGGRWFRLKSALGSDAPKTELDVGFACYTRFTRLAWRIQPASNLWKTFGCLLTNLNHRATSDPSCLAAVLYLQLVVPGRYSLVECTSPDSSPSGGLVSRSYEPRCSPNTL